MIPLQCANTVTKRSVRSTNKKNNLLRHLRYSCAYFKRNQIKKPSATIEDIPEAFREEARTNFTDLPDRRSENNPETDEKSTCQNSVCCNPYSKSLPCCVMDVLSGEVLCKPTEVDLKNTISDELDCKDHQFKCCKPKKKPSEGNTETAHRLGICDKDRHIYLATSAGNTVTLCESFCYNDDLGRLIRYSSGSYI